MQILNYSSKKVFNENILGPKMMVILQVAQALMTSMTLVLKVFLMKKTKIKSQTLAFLIQPNCHKAPSSISRAFHRSQLSTKRASIKAKRIP
jgi:hypothetical protein